MPTKVHTVKDMVFPVVKYGCESWESWALKNWCFWTVVLEETLENPLDCKEIKPVNPKENQSWVFIGRTDAEAPILWPPDATHWKRPWCHSLEKTLMLGKIEGRRRWGWQRMRWLDGITDLNGHEFEQAPRDGEGQGSLVCCSPWGGKKLDMTEWLNGNNNPDLRTISIDNRHCTFGRQ